MHLKRGYIAYFRYKNHHHDPYPLALVLYVGEKLVHCLNIHYLGPYLTDELVTMIAQIALGKLRARDMYRFYHNYIKRILPDVVKNSYRTYKPQYITDIVIVSKGFDSTQTFLNTFKNLFSKEKTKTEMVEKKIKKEIEVVEKLQKTPEEIIQLNRLKPAQVTSSVEKYFNKIKNIVKNKIDPTQYTGVRRK